MIGRKAGAQERFTAAQVSAALTESRGVKAVAARILGCEPATIYNYLNRYVSCREAYEVAIRSVTDIARGNVIKAIMAGDVQESKWWLTKKDPEFREVVRQEQTGAGGGPVTVRVVYDEPRQVIDGESREIEGTG